MASVKEFQGVIAAIREDRAELVKFKSTKDPRWDLHGQMISFHALTMVDPYFLQLAMANLKSLSMPEA